jgi:hypothetical protein
MPRTPDGFGEPPYEPDHDRGPSHHPVAGHQRCDALPRVGTQRLTRAQ